MCLNGHFLLASIVVPLRDFSLVRFSYLVKKCNPLACALFKFCCLIFLAHKARCKPDVLEGGSVLFCMDPGGSLIDVATQAGPNIFVIVSLICVPCKHDPAVHFCQLEVGNDLCWMFGRRAKRKWEPGVDLTIASHLEFVVVVCEQEPADCWDGGFISSLGALALRGHCE